MVSRAVASAPLAFRVVRRLCERPGCGAVAEVSYGIDKNNLVVWVDNRAILERELAGRLCRRHANALVPPRGWTLDDRREPIPKLFVTRDDGTAAAAPARGTKSPKRSDHPSRSGEPAPVLEFPSSPDVRPARDEPVEMPVVQAPDERGAVVSGAETAPSVAAAEPAAQPADDGDDVRELVYESDGAAGIDPDETQAVPWSPRLVRTDAADDPSGPVFGRLLGRAFGRRDDDE